MTAENLLSALAEYIENVTEDIILPVKQPSEIAERPCLVYKMRPPTVEDREHGAPYIVVQYLKTADDWGESNAGESTATVRLVAVTYNKADASEGLMSVMNVLERMRISFLRNKLVGEKYRLLAPIETMIYTENQGDFYVGEMLTKWEKPPVVSEIDFMKGF